MNKCKRIIFALVCVVILARLAYVFLFDNVDREYIIDRQVEAGEAEYVSCDSISIDTGFSYDRLYKLELLMQGVGEGVPGSLDITLLKDNRIIYETKKRLDSMENEWWTALYVNTPVVVGDVYKINISLADNEGVTPYIALASDGKPLVAAGYLKPTGRRDKLIYMAIAFVLMLISYVLIRYFEVIKEKAAYISQIIGKKISKRALYSGFEFLSCLVIMNWSGIDFQNTTKVVLLIISLISIIGITEKRSILDGMNKYVRAAMYLYMAFALVGQRIFLFPLGKKITVLELLVFLATVVWVIPVVDSFIYYLDKFKNHFAGAKTLGMKKVIFMIAVTLILMLPTVLNLIANNPGISLQDTMTNMLENAHNIQGMLDWHPAIYAMLLRVIFIVWDSTYAVLIVQYVFWIYVMLEFFMYIRKKGVSDVYILLMAFATGINASNILLLNTILKDLWYTCCLFWAVVIIAKLTIDLEEYANKWYIYAELILSLTGLFMLRKNGLVVFIFIAVSLGIVLRKNYRIFVSVVISIVLIGLIKGPLYNHFEIENTGKFGMYIGLSQDILGVYYYGGNISEDTLAMINVMTEGDNAQYHYTPTWSFSSYYLDVEATEFIKNYIDTFIKNPGIMTQAIIARVDGVWDIFDGEEAVMVGVNSTGTMEQFESWKNFYPSRKPTALYEPMLKFTTFTAKNQWIASIVWRVGIAVAFGLVAFVYFVYKKGLKAYLIIMAPFLGQFVSLLLSTGWSEFRYFWPFAVMNMYLIAFIMILLNKDGENKDESFDI